MKIAQVAPLYESVPPQLYGGTERVVSYLTEELMRQGHDVTLFASGDSRTSARLIPASKRSLRLDPECRDHLAHHVLMLEKVARHAEHFDVIHFHIDYLHYPLSRRSAKPHLTTLHGRLDLPELQPLYAEFREMPVVSISDAQRIPLPGAAWLGTIHHGLPLDLYTFTPRAGRYLAFVGRVSPEKRLDRAIEIARRCKIELRIAAKVDPADRDYFRDEIEPLLDGPYVDFVGEIGEAEKSHFLGGALALLFPIDWPEPSIGSAVLAAVFSLALAGSAQAAARPDAWLTTKVKMSLLTSEGISGSMVHVDTVDGRVTLHGSVPTAEEKARATEVAKQVEGVRDVRNLLQVVPKASADRVDATDAQIEENVAKALRNDPALKSSSIGVQSVNNGVVLLSGKAQTLSDTYRAVDTAARVPGVRRVASEIQSPDVLADEEIWRDSAYDAASYDQSTARDTWITTAAKMRLLANSETPGFDINVDTDDRVVTLFGMVPTAAAKQAAQAEVAKVDGVRSVGNDLQVVAAAQQDRVADNDDQIEDAIEARFEAHAFADDAIDVEVTNGVARLTGTVKSRQDQITALTVARTTDGVKKVIDDLRLEAPAVSAR